MIVFCLDDLPFCAVIVVGITSFLAQMLPNAASALCEPMGSSTRTLDAGTSGVEANVVVVMLFLMFVLPTRITRRWFGSSTTRSRSGNAAPACETRIAGPRSGCGSVGVFTTAPPTKAPLGQRSGLVLNTASVQAFCSVVSLEGSERGSWTLTDLMFAWPSPWVTSVISVAPFEREVLWLELALNFGANFSALQFAT